MPAAAALPRPAPAQTGTPAGPDLPRLDVTPPHAAGTAKRTFFTQEQFAALEKLADLIAPASPDRPGAKEAEVAAFLDMLVSQSSAEQQKLYRAGLDRLNRDRPFASATSEQAAALLAPLAQPWTYDGPADPFARFLAAAKQDILRATVNSHAFVTALSSRTRGAAGTGYYWLPVE